MARLFFFFFVQNLLILEWFSSLEKIADSEDGSHICFAQLAPMLTPFTTVHLSKQSHERGHSSISDVRDCIWMSQDFPWMTFLCPKVLSRIPHRV